MAGAILFRDYNSKIAQIQKQMDDLKCIQQEYKRNKQLQEDSIEADNAIKHMNNQGDGQSSDEENASTRESGSDDELTFKTREVETPEINKPKQQQPMAVVDKQYNQNLASKNAIAKHRVYSSEADDEMPMPSSKNNKNIKRRRVQASDAESDEEETGIPPKFKKLIMDLKRDFDLGMQRLTILEAKFNRPSSVSNTIAKSSKKTVYKALETDWIPAILYRVNSIPGIMEQLSAILIKIQKMEDKQK